MRAATVVVLLTLLLPRPSPARPLDRLPPLVLWSWERADDLRFLDPSRAGAAVLTGTLTLEGGTVAFRPRRAPVRLPAGVRTLAVVRIEAARGRPPALDTKQRGAAARALLGAPRPPDCVGLQIDFDAARSQRAFYRDLLAEVRSGLPDSLALGITALASWCDGDRWLGSLPVDEVVAMAFRLGPDGPALAARLARGDRLRARECDGAIGVALDEPRRVPRRGRTYVFSPRRWSAADVREVESWLGR